MTISFELDTNVLKILNVNLSQLLFINLIYSKTPKGKVKEFIKTIFMDESDFNNLIERGIVSEDSELVDCENIKLTKEFEKKYKEMSKDDFFEEFLEIYPKYVTRPDGLKSFIRNNPKKCRQLYKQLVGNDRDKHRHIMKCLLYEVNDRELTGQMCWMKTMNNWLTQEGWIYAEQRFSDLNEERLPGYGEDII